MAKKKTKNQLADEAFRRRARLRGNTAAGTFPKKGRAASTDPTHSRQMKIGGRSRTVSVAGVVGRARARKKKNKK